MAKETRLADQSAISRQPSAPPDAFSRRVVIERIQPEIDGGRFPIKRTIGEIVDVSATIFADGHDVLMAVLRDRTLQHRGLGVGDWGLEGMGRGDHSPATPIPNPQSPIPPGI